MKVLRAKNKITETDVYKRQPIPLLFFDLFTAFLYGTFAAAWAARRAVFAPEQDKLVAELCAVIERDNLPQIHLDLYWVGVFG